MTDNSRLVQYFISSFYSSKTYALEHVTSTTFKFTVDGGEEMDFNQYAKRKDLMSGHCQLDFEEPTSADDVNFSAKLKLAVPRKDLPSLNGTGVIKFLVSDNLLQEVVVSYDQTGENNNSLQAAILDSRSADKNAVTKEQSSSDELMFL